MRECAHMSMLSPCIMEKNRHTTGSKGIDIFRLEAELTVRKTTHNKVTCYRHVMVKPGVMKEMRIRW